MIRTGTPDRVLRLIGKSHPSDVAPLFKDLEPNEARLLFDVLFSTRKAAKTLKELPPDLLSDILALIEDERLARVIARADPDDAVSFIAALPEERKEKIRALMDPEQRAGFNKMISYPEGTVGRIMTTDLLSLSPGLTAQGAIDKIRERGELETFFYLYVVDEADKLIGVVPIRNLVVAPPDRPLRDMMITDPIRAEVTMDQEEAARLVEIEAGNLSQLLKKEWSLGLIKGTIFGTVLGIVAWLWKGNAALGLVAGLAMFLNMLVAATGGVLVPTALRRLGLDPATVAGVFDTMLTDFMGFLIFLGLATLLIHFLT